MQWNSTWNNIVGVYDDANNATRIYVNGQLANTTNCTWQINKTLWDDAESLRIGGDDSITSDWNGMIDEVVIWNRTLTDTEINKLYNIANEKYFWQVKATDCNESTFSNVYEYNTTTPELLCIYDCSFTSSIDSNVDCLTNDLIFYNSGTININANITNWNKLIASSCKIAIQLGNRWI